MAEGRDGVDDREVVGRHDRCTDRPRWVDRSPGRRARNLRPVFGVADAADASRRSPQPRIDRGTSLLGHAATRAEAVGYFALRSRAGGSAYTQEPNQREILGRSESLICGKTLQRCARIARIRAPFCRTHGQHAAGDVCLFGATVLPKNNVLDVRRFSLTSPSRLA